MISTSPPSALVLCRSNLHHRTAGPWYKLAIHATKERRKYSASIQFFAHPSKEPVQLTGDFASAVQVAVFFIAYDPAVLPKTNSEVRTAYDLQVHALLADFDKVAPIYSRR